MADHEKQDDEAIAKFISITSAPDGSARQYLEVCNQDLERAVALFFENGGSILQDDTDSRGQHAFGDNHEETADNNAESQTADTGNRAESALETDVRAPIAPTRGVLMDDTLPAGSVSSTSATQFGSGFGMIPNIFSQRHSENPLDSDISSSQVVPGNGIGPFAHFSRRVPGIFNQRPIEVNEDDEDTNDIGGEDRRLSAVTGGQSNTSEKANRLARLFSPPFDIISNYDFETAKSEGRNKGRWVLFNLQDISDFQCQVLNRDLWSDDQVKEIVRENFIFIQSTTDSTVGTAYKVLYDVRSFPHISIIDPRTGECVKRWSRAIEVEDFVTELCDFLGRFSLDGQRRNPIAKKARRKSSIEHMTEQEQIDAAIRASVGDMSDGSSIENMTVVDEEVLSDRSLDNMKDSRNGPTKTSKLAQKQKAKETVDVIHISDDTNGELVDDGKKVNAENKQDVHKQKSKDQSRQSLSDQEWNQIPARETMKPSNTEETTSIRIRAPAPLPVILHTFRIDELVSSLYGHVKSVLPLEDQCRRFSLRFFRKPLDPFGQGTLKEHGLKNVTLEMDFDT